MATRAVAQDPQVEKLRTITNTTQLVRYLHTELDWPVDVEEVEDAFFEWRPDELFLNDEHRVDIGSIKQLRPLTNGQPWGIFFVEFERKRLPIVVLRRVLNSLAIKRRASAKKGGGHQTWHARDLLFVSSFGESGHREIALAHFTDESEFGDLPVLRVLGWDEDDTSRQLEKVAATLQSRLRWPARTDGAEAQKAWREQWAGAFTLQYRQAINDAKSLALALAHLAKRIRLRANDVLKAESERGHLHKLHQAFKDNLIADLTPDGFADMFAQTIAYGLFTAHVSRGSGALVADDVALMVPSTNPFLRDLLQDFLQAAGRARQRHQRVDFDELGINDVVDLLRHAPMDDILRSFNSERPGEDPVIHFYEDFLKAYDKKMRAKRGVFYTPRPVVQFIVRSVHEILQTEFGVEDGLASTITWGEMRKRKPELALPAHTGADSPFVQILDPATGTATFLVETIDIIYRHMLAKWRAAHLDNERIAACWNAYVQEHLLPRLHGFELMMAPYAIAHMKIGLKLAETGYTFPENGPRVNVFLTNALQPAHEVQRELEGMAPMLAHEANAANATKQQLAATVVIGNPPYSGISGNMFPWIDGLLKGQLPDGTSVQSYYQIDGRPLGEKKVWLQDDYVKFIRFGQWRIECSGIGVLGYITNHGYLDNPTFRGMRQCLMNTFGRIDVIDLHGNSKKKEKAADGSKDENVFDIEQGVAIALMATVKAGQLRQTDLFGSRESKHEALLQSPHLKALVPAAPNYFFTVQRDEHKRDYEAGWPLSNIMSLNTSGIVTARDHLVVSLDRKSLISRIERFVNPATSDQEIRKVLFAGMGSDKYPDGDSRGWKMSDARNVLRQHNWRKDIIPTLYRPFDVRQMLYRSDMVDWPRTDVVSHLLSGPNISLLGTRLTKDQWDVGATRLPITHKALCIYDITYQFPLWAYVGDAHRADLHDDDLISKLPGRSVNLNPAFISALCEAMSLEETAWQPEKAAAALNAEKVFHYFYAVLHSPEYRERYADFLRIDFPRIPVPDSRILFDTLCTLGGQLVQWQLLEHATAVAITTSTAPRGVSVPTFFGNDRKLLKVAEKGRDLADPEATSAGPLGKVCINATSGFSGVRQAVWEHSIGGYQVLHKWLDDRRKAERSLSDDDIAHWRRVYAALEATQSLMRQVDSAIAGHGGWPDAFSQNHPPPDPATLAAQPATKRPRAKRASAGQSALFGGADETEETEYQPRPKAKATPARGARSAGGAVQAELDDDASMAAMREALRIADEPLARNELIRLAASLLGYKRTGQRVAAALDDAVRRAVRRGIAIRERGNFRLLTPNISAYDRDFLKTQLLACLSRNWVEREGVARGLARWLGFARTGATIAATVKSLITSLLRNGALERRGDEVRRT